MTDSTKIVGIILLLILLIGLGPLITIWSLNTIFMVTPIAYSFKTWLATLLLQSTFAGLARSKT